MVEIRHGKSRSHSSLTRTAQIYLELHFCVELHIKKALVCTCCCARYLTAVPVEMELIVCARVAVLGVRLQSAAWQ